MRDYGKVFVSFWSSEDIRGFSEDGRALALYLMTCPHGNMLGCFRLPDAYAADDLQWSFERVSNGFEELSRYGFAYRCKRSFWLVIHKHLKWNSLDNENVGKAAAKLYDSITPPDDVKAMLAKALQLFGKNFPALKLEEIETVLEGYLNGIETLSKPVTVTGAVTGAVTVTGTATASPGGLFGSSGEMPPKSKAAIEKLACPVEDIVSVYHELMPDNPRVKVLNDARRKAIKARWAEAAVLTCKPFGYTNQADGLTAWRFFFEVCSGSKFLTGKAPGRDGKPPFVADIDFLFSQSGFAKCLENKYHREAA
jgi:hypothetical protein